MSSKVLDLTNVSYIWIFSNNCDKLWSWINCRYPFYVFSVEAHSWKVSFWVQRLDLQRSQFHKNENRSKSERKRRNAFLVKSQAKENLHSTLHYFFQSRYRFPLTGKINTTSERKIFRKCWKDIYKIMPFKICISFCIKITTVLFYFKCKV